MSKIICVVLLWAAPAAFAQDPETERAAATVARLHDTALDPASFVLDGVYVTKVTRPPNKHNIGQAVYCYAYRAHNTMGGYSAARATEDPGLEHGRLQIIQADRNGDFPGYDTGLFGYAPCKTKNIDRDITADVAALAPSLYKKTK
jgi:hypothetical protein